MDQFEPGDLVKHLVNGEEGHYLRPVVWCVGTNKGAGYLVDVAGVEKMWLEHETQYFGNPKPPKPEEPLAPGLIPTEDQAKEP